MIRVSEYDLLCRDFSLGVHAQRVHCRSLIVVSLLTVEDQITGQQEQRDVRGQLCEQGGDFDVELASKCGVGLACGTSTKCGAVDNKLRCLAAKLGAHGGSIGQLKASARKRDY